jgi:RNA polymerase-binding transcription factor DksA
MRTDIDIGAFKVLLEKERGALREQLTSVARQNPNNPSDWVGEAERDLDAHDADPNDAADRFESLEEHRIIADELETRFNEVNAALERIKDGTYGICVVSGEHIEVDRLNANPSATTCKAHMNI